MESINASLVVSQLCTHFLWHQPAYSIARPFVWEQSTTHVYALYEALTHRRDMVRVWSYGARLSAHANQVHNCAAVLRNKPPQSFIYEIVGIYILRVVILSQSIIWVVLFGRRRMCWQFKWNIANYGLIRLCTAFVYVMWCLSIFCKVIKRIDGLQHSDYYYKYTRIQEI